MALVPVPRVRWVCLALAGAVFFALLPAVGARAQQSPVGLWETVSDVDGRPKSHVRIREVQGELLGTVEVILDPKKRDALCDKCADQRRDQPVQGMLVLSGMRREAQGEHYAGGSILDPDNGKVYSCKLVVVDEGRHLEVRGFIGFSLFGRTQTWNRLE
jgi:uncharacterized protein (DUF2147 family)